MGEADPNGDLNLMSGPHGNKCGRQRDLACPTRTWHGLEQGYPREISHFGSSTDL